MPRIETVIRHAKRMRDEGLPVAAIEIDGGRVTFRFGQPMDSADQTGNAILD